MPDNLHRLAPPPALTHEPAPQEHLRRLARCRVLLFCVALLGSCARAPSVPALLDEPPPAARTLGEAICLVAGDSTLRTPQRLDAALVHLRALGIAQVRWSLTWALVERVAGVYDLDWLQAPLQKLEAAGVRSIAMLGYGNTLYNGRTDGDADYPSTEPAPFGAFAGAVAARFGTRLSAYELWNEPNAGYRFFKPREDAVRFAGLVDAAQTRIRAQCPACTVLFGGVFWHNEFIVGGVDFIRAAYAALPSLRTLDGLAIHPYSYYPPVEPPDSAQAPEVPLGDKLSLAADATLASPRPPVWITEIGWPQTTALDEASVAAYLVKTFALGAQAESRATCWYDLQDGPHPESFPPEDAFGLLTYDPAGPGGPSARPKRAYLALRTLSSLVGKLGFSRSRRAELGLGGDEENALLFRDSTGQHGVTVYWRGRSPREATLKVALHRGVTTPAVFDLAGQPLTLTREGDAVRVPLSTEPAFLVE